MPTILAPSINSVPRSIGFPPFPLINVPPTSALRFTGPSAPP